MKKMNHDFFKHPEISRFRADDEDVNAYVQSIIRNTNKQEILSWINHLSDHDLHSLITPYITEKMTEELAEEELS
jgi:cell fate (sporulation/competence/biofilm development) regulator YmcA (YheA/YmcA/DUF963 family)